MAKVLLVTEFFPPETYAGANRVGSMADALSVAHEVTVLTLLPSYPDPGVYEDGAAEAHDHTRPYNVIRRFHFTPHSRNLVVRAAREHFMAARLASRGIGVSADVVLTSSPSMFLGPVCLALSKFKRARFVWDVRDIGWELARESPQSSLMGLGARLLREYMWAVARRADIVVGASRGGAAQIRRATGATTSVLLVENSISTELLDACRACSETVDKARPLVTYVGLLGLPQAVGTLVEVARIIPDTDFLIVGDGPERAKIQARVSELQLNNIALTGYVGRAQILELYRRSDALFGQLKDLPTLNHTSLPSKLYEYMATGKPIIYAGRGIASELVELAQSGVVVAPEDPHAIATAIATLTGDPGYAETLGRNGRAFVESESNRERAVLPLVEALKQ